MVAGAASALHVTSVHETAERMTCSLRLVSKISINGDGHARNAVNCLVALSAWQRSIA